jgi:aldose 1-epimerase
MMTRALSILAALSILTGCGSKTAPSGQLPLLDKAAWETTVDGQPVSLYTLANASGATLQLTNYGSRMVSLWVPDRDGVMRDVLLGYETIEGALADNASLGPVVGRYGNRIAAGRFTLDGVEYQLNLNNGPNQLHGGPKGWATKVWDASGFTDSAGNQAVKMTLVSPDGDEKYPGAITLEVTYTLTPQNEVVIDYRATTDAPTVLNPTSHGYFNLHGTATRSILSHVVMINADGFTPTDAGLIPTGEIRPVEGTPLDFRTPTPVGDRIDADYEPLNFGGGYDHNWVLNKTAPGEVSLAVEVYEPSTGIVMKVLTDQPGVQFYSGNSLNGPVGKYGETYARRTGLALETQHYPDSPNHPEFPSTVLRPGEVYTQHTVYSFSIR